MELRRSGQTGVAPIWDMMTGPAVPIWDMMASPAVPPGPSLKKTVCLSTNGAPVGVRTCRPAFKLNGNEKQRLRLQY